MGGGGSPQETGMDGPPHPVCFPTLHKSEEPSPLPRGAHYSGTWPQMPYITHPVPAMFFHPKRQGHLTTPNPHVCPPHCQRAP